MCSDIDSPLYLEFEEGRDCITRLFSCLNYLNSSKMVTISVRKPIIRESFSYNVMLSPPRMESRLHQPSCDIITSQKQHSKYFATLI